MDLQAISDLLRVASSAAETAVPDQAQLITLGSLALAAIGLVSLVFGLRFVRIMCVLACVPFALVGGGLLAKQFGVTELVGALAAIALAIVAGAVLFRVLLGGAILLTLWSLGLITLGSGYADAIHWERLYNLENPIDESTPFVNPYADFDISKWDVFRERATEEWNRLTDAHPAFPYVAVGVAFLCVVAAVALVVYLWKLASMGLAIMFGLQAFALGGGVFILRTNPELFDFLMNNMEVTSTAIMLLGLAASAWQIYLLRRLQAKGQLEVKPQPATAKA